MGNKKRTVFFNGKYKRTAFSEKWDLKTNCILGKMEFKNKLYFSENRT